MQKKFFWLIFLLLDTLATLYLSFLWAMVATIPIILLSWWLVYRTGWFE